MFIIATMLHITSAKRLRVYMSSFSHLNHVKELLSVKKFKNHCTVLSRKLTIFKEGIF